MTREAVKRIDSSQTIREALLPYCRLRTGEVWEDAERGHRVGCLDASNAEDVQKLLGREKCSLAVQDPPYNLAIGNVSTERLGRIHLDEYVEWSRRWVDNTLRMLRDDANLYVWLGADQNDGFQPLADFMILMREFKDFRARSFITMRNQRGYGTQRNWMAVRQELLYYVKGSPTFNVEAEYTDIPKILRGYYKEVRGELTENIERSKSTNIRAGNVWVDIQQVFYRMEENVPGCYAQKPLKAIERIVSASSSGGDAVVDLFAHSGTTLLACERLGRRCFTCDIDPVFAEITIRRLEHHRQTGKTGWQFETPFPEVNVVTSGASECEPGISPMVTRPEKCLFDPQAAGTL